ncbi:MAG: PAS domain S-box protein, partial [Desulfobacteraceae bacterium]
MRFRTKQMLIFSLLMALICIAFLVFSLGFYKNRMVDEAEYRRSSLAMHLHKDIINMIYAEDVLQLTATLRSICKDVTYIDYIFIIGDDGHLLTHTFDTGFPSELFNVNLLPADKTSSSRHLLTSKGRIRDFAIRTARHMQGEIHVGMNEEVFYKQINDFVKITIIITIVCLALGLFLVYVISGYLSKPLKNLYLGMKKIEKGDLQYRLEEKGDYEVLNLLQGYNRMTESILDSTTRLKQAKEKIEKLNSVLYAIRSINKLITMEKDRDRLLQGACDNLAGARSLYSAWITLLDESGAFVKFAQAGFGEDFLPIKEMLNQGELPACGRIALKQPDVVVTEDPASNCTNCSLKDRYGDRGSIAVRLEHGGNVYGLLTVTVPKDVIIEKEEMNLLKESAGDIAIALHGIELEKKQKQAEEALQNSEERLARAIEGNSIPTFIIDKNHTITHWNKSCENLTGIPALEMVGTKKHSLAFYPEERPVLADLIAGEASEEEIEGYYKDSKLNKSGLIEGAYEDENFFPNLGEKGKWLFFTASPLKNRQGEVTGAIETIQDITEKRNTEDQLRQAQKMEAIGALAGGIAHDFNNLLTSIIGNAQLALNDISKDDSLREQIEEIKKAGERSASLTRQLLAFSRKQVIKPEVLD